MLILLSFTFLTHDLCLMHVQAYIPSFNFRRLTLVIVVNYIHLEITQFYRRVEEKRVNGIAFDGPGIESN